MKNFGLLLVAALLTCAALPAHGMSAAQAEALAKASAEKQNLPAAMATGTVAAAVKALTSLPDWSPLYPNASISAVGTTWEEEPAQKTASGMVSFQTKDTRAQVADFYARSFARKGAVTEIRSEEPWTIEVMSKDETEVMTLTLDKASGGGTDGLLRYNKAPTAP